MAQIGTTTTTLPPTRFKEGNGDDDDINTIVVFAPIARLSLDLSPYMCTTTMSHATLMLWRCVCEREKRESKRRLAVVVNEDSSDNVNGNGIICILGRSRTSSPFAWKEAKERRFANT